MELSSAISISPIRAPGDRAHEAHDALAQEAVSRRNRFQSLIERHERRLRGLAFGLLGDPSRVDDVLQEAFIRAYRKLPRHFANERHEAAWLYTIVHRCCLNELRSVKRRREDIGIDDALAAPRVSAQSLLLAEALAELPTDQRAVVLLVDQIGFDYETAAAILGTARGTVAWRLSEARARLRTVLSEADR